MKTHSPMVNLAEEYLAVRRRLGYLLKIEGAELLRFARYADRGGHRGPITTELAVRWAKLPEHTDPLYWARRLDIVRRFAKARAVADPETEIPPDRLLGPSYRRPRPHIYSQDEIATLLDAAGKLGPPGGLRPHTYVTLFGLLVCTGMRISEVLGLMQDDVDLQRGTIAIRHAKFDKSRRIPIHSTSIDALRDYAHHRDRYHSSTACTAFFLTERATSQKYHRTLMTFLRLRKELGWQLPVSGNPPRLHDLRHTFAVRTLLRWYKEGVDVDTKIIALSTYLGHAKVSDTYWYLTGVPELLEVVARRFEVFARQDQGGGR